MEENYRADADRIINRLPAIKTRLQTPQASLYISEILRFNNKLGLISKRKPDVVLEKMFIQCTKMWDYMVEGTGVMSKTPDAKVLDIGSGGGFPGMVWKLLEPKLLLTFVERKAGRALFLERTASLMGLRGVRVIEDDARSLEEKTGYESEFDIVTMLAVAPPERFSPVIDWALKAGGVFVALRSHDTGAFPQAIGRRIELHSSRKGLEGTYLLYEKSS